MRRLALTLIALTVALALATGAGAAARGTLKVTYWAHGSDGASRTWTLRCGASATGTHPARRLACSALAKHAVELTGALRPCALLPSLRAPRAKVTGTWNGRKVNRTFRSGCPGWTDLKVVLTGKA